MKLFSGQLMRGVAVSLTSLAFYAVCTTARSADYAEESKDFGVSEMTRPKGSPYNLATPMTLPGGKTITTDQLKEMLVTDPNLIVIDALASSVMIEGAKGLGNGIGEQRMFGQDRAMFPKALSTLTAGDKAKAIVFYCRSSKCWHSYNASLHAIDAGYTNVYWYRGGIDAWQASGGKTTPYAVADVAK